MRRIAFLFPLASALALSLSLTGCFDDDDDPTPTPPPTSTPTPAPTPAPTPTPTPASFNVTRCLTQTVVPGRTVANLVVPDLLRLDLSQPAGFPNGRRYLDPVIDVTLAIIFLDLTRHPATTFASIPVNPGPNSDPGAAPMSATFPFLSPPQGTPPPPQIGGANWNFRTDPATAYVRVDRAAMPAVATALIGGPNKNPYNDDNPAIDATGKWVPELTAQLVLLTNALADDFGGLGLSICATPG